MSISLGDVPGFLEIYQHFQRELTVREKRRKGKSKEKEEKISRILSINSFTTVDFYPMIRTRYMYLEF